MRERVICPDTGHLEEVDLATSDGGLLVIGCSRFEPNDQVYCQRECTRRLDRRARSEQGDISERVLVVYENARRTRHIAEKLARELTLDGLDVELGDADQGQLPPPEDYEAVVIGTAKRWWRSPRSLLRFIKQHQKQLVTMPTFMFSVDGSPAEDLGHIAERTGWLPMLTATFDRHDTADAIRPFALAIGEDVPALESSH